jgi:hypothetical protein
MVTVAGGIGVHNVAVAVSQSCGVIGGLMDGGVQEDLAPVIALHTLAVRSRLAVTMCVPFGLNAALNTSPV